MSSLPEKGFTPKEVVDLLDSFRATDRDRKVVDWKTHCFFYTWHVNEEVSAIAEKTYLDFLGTDNMSGGVFPSVRKMRGDLVEYALELFQGSDDSTGIVTAGGTESMIVSLKCARDWARSALPAISTPELICPSTAHPSCEKAAELLGFSVVRVPVKSNYEADATAIEAAITPNTFGLVLSVCNPWYGTSDPVVNIGALARERNLWLHVDACIGGYLAPFVRKLRHGIPPFSFEVEGVRSISADLHKYGYTPKGASIAVFSRQDDAAPAFFSRKDEFIAYATAGVSGTRGGGAIAAAWAVMNLLGERGYLDAASAVMHAAQTVRRAVESIEDLFIFGEPQLGIVAFGSDNLNLADVAAELEDRGWIPNLFGNPPFVMLRMAPCHGAVIDDFVSALRESAASVRSGKRSSDVEPQSYGDS